MSIIEIIFGILISLEFVLGVIGVIVEKIRSGKSWIGQGYGKK